MARLVILCGIVFCCSFLVLSNSKNRNNEAKQETGVSITPNTEAANNDNTKQENTKEDAVNINSPNDVNNMDTMNPQLIAALKQINDDPSYLKSEEGSGELIDLSQFQMDPQKLEEMIEIFDWIESQLPPDDPQQIQIILNNVEQLIADETVSNYTSTGDALLLDLTVLPNFLYQVDNGVDFMKMNGVQILLKAYNRYNPLNDIENRDPLNRKNTTLNYLILSQIMDVIGVATQNNFNAISIVHESNVVSFIVDELNEIYSNYKNNSIPIDGQLMNKLMFTLSSITRQSDTGLQRLQQKNAPKVLYKCAKLLIKELNKNKNKNDHNLERAFKKLLTMISDIVVLNGNSLEYGQMFLNSGKWCGFMIEKGLMFHTESVLQFINYGLQRNYCVEHKMLLSLQNKLNQIVEQQTNKHSEDDQDYFDDGLLTQSSNMLKYIQKNFDIDKKTEL